MKNEIKNKIMGKKFRLSYRDYRQTCNDAYTVNISNPTLFWNASDGFYIAPSRDLIPNDDLCLGLAYYNLNNGGKRNFSGSRCEYQPIAAGIRKFYATEQRQRTGTLRDYIAAEIENAEWEQQ